MISNPIILEGIPYNKELASKKGIEYDVFDEVVIDHRYVVVDHDEGRTEFPHKCIWDNSDCATCTENEDYDWERVRISPVTSKQVFEFRRTKHLTRGAVWSNWYDYSYAITPAK